MYDIKPLEEEWKKYNKKKRRPWFILLFSIFFILLLSLTFLNYKEIDLLKFYDTSKKEIVINKSTNTLLIDKALSTLEIKKPKVSEALKIEAVEPMAVTSSENGYIEVTEVLPIAEDVETIKKPKVKMHLEIIETTNVNAYKDVANRFKHSHDTDDSLFLAKAYYRRGNYKKSEYWALQTNKVNDKIEESWLIFAKSKVKLGHKNEAINILKTYIKKTNSSQAKSLLYKIKKGTL